MRGIGQKNMRGLSISLSLCLSAAASYVPSPPIPFPQLPLRRPPRSSPSLRDASNLPRSSSLTVPRPVFRSNRYPFPSPSSLHCIRKHLAAVDLERANPPTAKQPIISFRRYRAVPPARYTPRETWECVFFRGEAGRASRDKGHGDARRRASGEKRSASFLAKYPPCCSRAGGSSASFLERGGPLLPFPFSDSENEDEW